MQVANRCIKICSMSLSIKKVQVEIITKDHLTIIRATSKEKKVNTSDDVSKEKHLYTADGNIN